MIVASSSPAAPARWVRAFAFVCVLGLLPFGVAGVQSADARPEEGKQAEDPLVARYRALEAKLKAAVEAGELTQAQADQKLIAARKSMSAEKPKTGNDAKDAAKNDAVRRQRFAEIQKKVAAALAAGEITKEQAEKKLAGARRWIFSEKPINKKGAKIGAKKTDARKAKYLAEKQKVRAAVEAGELTKEEGDRRIKQLRMDTWPTKKHKSDQSRQPKMSLEQMQAKIKAKVRAGELSAEDGEKRLDHHRRLLELRKSLDELVKGNKLTQEEADKKYDAGTKEFGGAK